MDEKCQGYEIDNPARLGKEMEVGRRLKHKQERTSKAINTVQGTQRIGREKKKEDNK